MGVDAVTTEDGTAQRALDCRALGVTVALHASLALWLLTGGFGASATLAAPGPGAMRLIAIAERDAAAAPEARITTPVETALIVPPPPAIEIAQPAPVETAPPTPPAPALPGTGTIGVARAVSASAPSGEGDDPQAGAATVRHGMLAMLTAALAPTPAPRLSDPGCPALDRARAVVGGGRVDLLVEVDADGHVMDARVAGGSAHSDVAAALKGLVCGAAAGASHWLTLTIDGGARPPIQGG